MPVYKYLRELGVQSSEECQARSFEIDRHIDKTPAEFSSTIYARPFVKTEREKTTEEIIASNPPEKAAIFLSFVQRDRFDQEAVRIFLADNIEKLDSANSNYATYFRKTACLYDYYVFGWHK